MNAIRLIVSGLLLASVVSSTVFGQQAQALDTVRVRVASRTGDLAASSSRTIEVITADEIARRPGYGLSDILASSLGIDVFRRSAAQADLAIRGSSFSQVVILVDGARVSDVQSGHYNLDLGVPIAAIERVEILRGGGSALYGPDAIGGVINIVTKGAAATAPTSNLAVHGGSFGTVGGTVAVGGIAGPAVLRLTTDADRSDGHRPGTDYRVVQSRLAASEHLLGGTVSGDAAIGMRNFGATDFYGPYPSFEDTRTSTASARYDRALNDHWDLQALADTRRHSDLYTLVKTNPSLYQNRHLSHQSGGRLVTSGRWDGVSGAVGAEGFDASLVSARLGDHDERREAAFSEVSLGGGRRPTTTLGAREDWSSRTGNFFSPSVAFSVPLAGTVTARASVNRGFRSPSWTEMYYTDPSNVANPDLQPETFVMSEFGLRAFPRWGRLDLALFTRNGKELIDWTKSINATPTTPWRASNVESARFRGVEAEAMLTDLLGLEWRVRGSGIAFRSRGADTLVGKYALSPITETVGLELTDRSVFGTRCSVNVAHARRTGEVGYWQSDVRATHAVRGVNVRVDALNLTNADYLDASRRPVAGRSFAVGLEVGK